MLAQGIRYLVSLVAGISASSGADCRVNVWLRYPRYEPLDARQAACRGAVGFALKGVQPSPRWIDLDRGKWGGSVPRANC